MGPLITILIQGLVLLVIACFAVGLGVLLSRLSPERTWLVLTVIGVATLLTAAGFWLMIRSAFESIETDAEGVATVLTAVVLGVWLTGLGSGYVLARWRRSQTR